ncbi:MAG: endolytic transglycosylase MltG [Spirochaetales bacterium]|uniref:Endolytic murein transglycosylase n=1 Tax=Candidatus Thalassospirochaeta sargassi TaxID=3119039 RepID=A0AAJ1MJK1_9SPIO|nr:endolytic transglycosylase MltG [Spirochaetales bacterium]
MKKIIVLLIVLLVIVIIAAGGLLFAAVKINSAPDNMPDQTFFRVNKGDNAGLIAENLFYQGMIRSSTFFNLYVRIMNTGGDMKSGLYRIKAGASTAEIHDILLQGSEELFKVAVPPGLTSTEIALILEDSGVTDAETFLSEVEKQEAEGFLFPDTYYFPLEYPADKVVAYMVEVFFNEAESVYPAIHEMSKEVLMEKVIMASVVEREYRRDDEAARIASVFYNRIDENMYLGSCATVVYIITEIEGREHPERLLYRDLDIESSYNTYRHKGLPPGPICNPGLTALNAAFNPDDTDYLYFLLEDPAQGNHTFSRSLAEHNRSYELYIKGK